MTSDADIWRAARDLIADHGARHAEVHAASRVDEMFSSGNFVGHLLWRRILKAVRGLNAQSGSRPAASAGTGPGGRFRR
ncbi:hypothetical protein V6B08_19020 [Ferrovibrio sp. MS7]|jgi:hypothetical protein|uniref:hypothetical protein n=1 Tax=Ferrovibrio plantarum TaxID=3119164 RepID=UPI001B4EA485|nr:hypothetical protein [Ferrovibrio sp.]